MDMQESSQLEDHHLLALQVINKLDQKHQYRNQTFNLLYFYSDRNWDSCCDQTYNSNRAD